MNPFDTQVGRFWLIKSLNKVSWDFFGRVGHKWWHCSFDIYRGTCSWPFYVMQIGRSVILFWGSLKSCSHLTVILELYSSIVSGVWGMTFVILFFSNFRFFQPLILETNQEGHQEFESFFVEVFHVQRHLNQQPLLMWYHKKTVFERTQFIYVYIKSILTWERLIKSQ